MKRMKFKIWGRIIASIAITALFTACNNNVINEEPLPPVITFDNTDMIYVVKIGKSIDIAPTVANDQGAVYTWKLNGKSVGSNKNYVFAATEDHMGIGELFLSLQVITNYGVDEKEVRIDITTLDVPVINLAVPEEGYLAMQNTELILDPDIESDLTTSYVWSVNGSQVSTEPIYTFDTKTAGEFTVKLNTANEDGTDQIEFKVNVVTPDQLPFKWVFDQTTFNLSEGRTIRITPFDIENAFDATYKWTINGNEVQSGDTPAYIFNGTTSGTYAAVVTMTNEYGEQSQNLTIKVDGAEGTYKRSTQSGSIAQSNKVYEFIAAPGQFVNKGYTVKTMSAACQYAEQELRKGGFVSLGGFGGSLTVGFDHSIENSGGYDLQIKGNQFANSSEPGIVWVMQDENGDGLPNDTWYELAGSEYGKSETIQEYAVTYYRPKGAGRPTAWTDNKGQKGTVDYLGQYNNQAYYYPEWIANDSYTLRGTCLKSNVEETRPGYWETKAYDWGYADNFSTVDMLGRSANHFKISDAKRFDGQPANLEYIDFVKIHTGVNAKAGWLGEISVEVVGVNDYNLIK